MSDTPLRSDTASQGSPSAPASSVGTSDYPKLDERGYLRFSKCQTRTITPIWLVESTSGSRLGLIKFFGRWRAFTFAPDELTTFNSGCMRDLAAFCDEVTAIWRQEVKSRG